MTDTTYAPDSTPLPASTAAIAETARHYLDVYAAFVHGFPPARHHRFLYQQLQALVEGRLTRPEDGSVARKLLIMAPPGSAKSTVVHCFICWYLGHHPGHPLLFFTSADDQANKYGGLVELCLEENERHQLVFPDPKCRPNPDRGWSSTGLYLNGVPQNQKDPSYRALGFWASSIGSRAMGVVMDDPLTQAQAQSEKDQESARGLHDQTIDTRLDPNHGWEVAIMTRWSQADMAAHLMAKEIKPGVKEWVVVSLPALHEYPWGRSIWPERFSEEFLVQTRHKLTEPVFNCVWQNDPTSLGGDVFRDAKWFKPLPSDFDVVSQADGKTHRERLVKVQFWDLAFSSKTSADWTVCVTGGIDEKQRVYLLDILRIRVAELVNPDEDDKKGLGAAIARQIAHHKPLLVGIENGAYRTATNRFIVTRVSRLLRKMGVTTVVTPVHVDRDKRARALLPSSIAEQGDLYVDRDAPWFQPFLAEVMAFPKGEHDDQVDGLSGMVQLAVENVDLLGHEVRDLRLTSSPAAADEWDPFDEHNAAIVAAEEERRQTAAAAEQGPLFRRPPPRAAPDPEGAMREEVA